MNSDRLLMALVVCVLALQLIQWRYNSTHTQVETRAAIAMVPNGTIVDITGMPSEGSDLAPVVLVEFSDYDCPYCARHSNGVQRELRHRFVTTGKVKHVFANNPLPGHANAAFLATAAICAGDQGHYWDMNTSIFGSRLISKSDIMAAASHLGLQAARFASCIDRDQGPLTRIETDTEIAARLNLNSTPSFAVGRPVDLGRVVVERFIYGAQPIDLFETAIGEVLRSKPTLAVR
jgi:protein-disulfide isomerase